MGKIACATGHRPEKFRFKYNEADPECINLKRVLKNEILKLINHGYDYFISGMALRRIFFNFRISDSMCWSRKNLA